MTNSELPHTVCIREVGPREGVQILAKVTPIEQRLKLIEALAHADVRQIEVAAFVRVDKVPQMADAEALVAALPQSSSVEYSALYLNTKGFERAERTGRLCNKGWLYSSPSNTFLQANNNTTIEQSIASVPEWIRAFKAHGKRVHGLMISTAFGCELEGPVAPSAVQALAHRFVAACAAHGEQLAELSLADTVGRGTPNSIRECIALLRPLGIPISLHLHDTWGLGLSNVYAALLEGVSIFESSIAGMGGCPFTPGAAGNVATEDIVYLCHSLGIETGIDFERLCDAAELAELVVGAPLPGRVYRARSAERAQRAVKIL